MSELHIIIWMVKQGSELQTTSHQIKIFCTILTTFSYFHVLTHFLGNFSIRMETMVEKNIFPLIYSQLWTVGCTDTHSTIKFYACNPSITAREGTFGLTPICTEKDEDKLEQWIRTEGDTKWPTMSI